MITREEVMRVLDYDPETGVFIRKVGCRGGVSAGVEAGAVQVTAAGKRYRVISVNGRHYRAHRLAWLILTDSFPDDQIDHINGCGLDNRAENLRAVSNSENSKNARKPYTNTSGVVGVYRRKDCNKWRACISVEGRLTHLGTFKYFHEALAARKSAEKTYGYHVNHGTERPL